MRKSAFSDESVSVAFVVMTLPALTLSIVGTAFPNKKGPDRKFELAICQPGEPIELRPEPKNPADPRAIAVYSCRGIQLGYLTAERAPRIGQLINQGMQVAAIFQELTKWGALIRAAFDGEMPRLPEKQSRQADQTEDFWPDFIPPEE